MRRRFQKPRIKNKEGYWIAQFRDVEGRKRKVSLGPVARTKKVDAETKLAKLLEPLNASFAEPASDYKFGPFIRQVYLPFYRRKWKHSTTLSNIDRIDHHLLPAFESQLLRKFTRDQLQGFLDQKATTLSYSVVAHLRWDLRQILRLGVAEGFVARNPAELLFIPRKARRTPTARMTLEQVALLFSILEQREQLIAALAILAGMRPGEIFALRRRHVENGYADVRQRVYRGLIDTPKTNNSKRWAALGDGLVQLLNHWLSIVPNVGPDAWVFPSEKDTTPLIKDNNWRRHFLPRLKPVGLEWANFQVMRRTHASLLDELGVDPQVRADQMGHSVDVNQNTYTRSSLERRRTAVNQLEAALKFVQD